MIAPIIKFVSVIGRTVSAIYLFLPIGSQVVLVDSISGNSVADPNTKAEGTKRAGKKSGTYCPMEPMSLA